MERGILPRCAWVCAERLRPSGKQRPGPRRLRFPCGGSKRTIEVVRFGTGIFPEQGEAIKSWFEDTEEPRQSRPYSDPSSKDAHQDHRHVCRLTWNTFRDHCILEYEIPKWDGDIGQPNLYMPISASTFSAENRSSYVHFGSQRSKHWFDDRDFRGLARLRGMECRAPERYAEAFFGPQAHSGLIDGSR